MMKYSVIQHIYLKNVKRTERGRDVFVPFRRNWIPTALPSISIDWRRYPPGVLSSLRRPPPSRGVIGAVRNCFCCLAAAEDINACCCSLDCGRQEWATDSPISSAISWNTETASRTMSRSSSFSISDSAAKGIKSLGCVCVISSSEPRWFATHYIFI